MYKHQKSMAKKFMQIIGRKSDNIIDLAAMSNNGLILLNILRCLHPMKKKLIARCKTHYIGIYMSLGFQYMYKFDFNLILYKNLIDNLIDNNRDFIMNKFVNQICIPNREHE